MNTDHLKIFANLAETLNFSLTAKTMHISQSAVSQAIKSIENELGFALFNRTKRRVSLTSAGMAFDKRLKTILTNFDQAIIDSREIYQHERSSLTIGSTGTTYEAHLLPLVIQNFRQLTPTTKIYLNTLDHNQLKQHLINQECDLIFTTQDDILDTPQLTFTPLVNGYFCVLVPLNNPLSSAKKLQLTDLTHQSLIMLTNNWCPPRQLQLQTLIKQTCPQADLTYVDNVATANTMVEAGLGLTVIPNFINCSSKHLFTVIPLDYSVDLAYGIATASDHTSTIATQFIHQLQHYDHVY